MLHFLGYPEEGKMRAGQVTRNSNVTVGNFCLDPRSTDETTIRN